MAKLNLFTVLLVLSALTFACQQEDKPVHIPEKIEPKLNVIQDGIKPDSMDLEIIEEATTDLVNVVSVNTKDNVVEFHQSFVSENGINLGEINDLDLSSTSGAMLSAYSLDVSDYEVFFRVRENGEFGEWIPMKLNDHVENPNRKVWNANSLMATVDKIQFKSSKALSSEVVFRVFKFAKTN